MKKLLYLFLATVALTSCTKDTDLDISSDSSEVLSFTISDDLATRAETDKTAWAVDDQVAIFEGDTETAKQYYVSAVDSDGKATLTNYVSDDVFVDNGEQTYTAYYPYVADRTLSEYKAQSDNADVLVSVTTSSGGAANFSTFTHANAYVSLNFIAGVNYSDNGFTKVYLELRDGSTTLWSDTVTEFGNDNTTLSYSFYCPAMSLEDVKLYMIANGDNKAYVVDFGADKKVTSWQAGIPYIYNSLAIGYILDIIFSEDPDKDFSKDLYEIYTAKGLEAFAALVNGHSAPEDLITNADEGYDSEFKFGDIYESINGKLMNDICLSSICYYVDGTNDISWTPIGCNDDDRTIVYYQGTFDGGGFEVSDLYINSENDNQGLFGRTFGATIKNLGVSGKVTGKSSVGGVVGASSYSSVSGCYNTGKVTSTGSSSCVGGVVGYSYDNNSVESCYNTGKVTSTGSSSCVGGVVGASSYSSVSGCYNTGIITAEGDASYIGGVVGASSYSSLTSCYSYGSVSSAVSTHLGGVLGTTDNDTIGYCYYDKTTVNSYYEGQQTYIPQCAIYNIEDGDTDDYCGLETGDMTDGTLLGYLETDESGALYWDEDEDPTINNGYPILTWQATE